VKSLDFYSTAATIYPIIFIAVLLEVAPERRDTSAEPPRSRSASFQAFGAVVILGSVAFLAIGEFAALHVLDVGHATTLWRGVVKVTLLATGGLLIGHTLARRVDPLGPIASAVAGAILLAGSVLVIVLLAIHY
jgi:hypothetical protein